MVSVSEICGGLIEYLKSCPGVSNVKIHATPPIALISVNVWEETHKVTLPKDIRDFYSVTDGLEITWGIQFPKKQIKGNEFLQIGHISVNAIDRLVPYNQTNSLGNGFILEDIKPHGKVCLVYKDSKCEGVYLHSQDSNWYFLAPDFTCYFRLQMHNLGIIGWQLSRTEMGMPQASFDWLNFFKPENPIFRECHSSRISIDRMHQKMKNNQKSVI